MGSGGAYAVRLANGKVALVDSTQHMGVSIDENIRRSSSMDRACLILCVLRMLSFEPTERKHKAAT